MAQKIIKFNCRSVKRRVAGKRNVAGEEKMNSVCGEISQLAKFRRFRKFSQPEKFSGKFPPPVLEHMQQYKTKNYEKLS